MKAYAMIPKREFNPELSAFSNLILDMVDFKDRVKPAAKDLALLDVSRKYQKVSVDEIAKERQEFMKELKNGTKGEIAESSDG
jgi:hypothetical protein